MRRVENLVIRFGRQKKSTADGTITLGFILSYYMFLFFVYLPVLLNGQAMSVVG